MLEHNDNLKIRIADINYGGHLGHVELINLLHETRVRFLNQYGLSEIDISGHVLIMRELNLIYKNQAFWNNELNIKMKLRSKGAKIIFDHSIHNLTLKNETASAEATMVLINKINERPVKPDLFIRMVCNDTGNGKYK